MLSTPLETHLVLSLTILDLHSMNPVRKDRAIEITKVNILKEFLLIGILEEFDDTIILFEELLPDFFRGGSEIWKKRKTHEKFRNYANVLTAETRDIISKGTLKHELDIYFMMKALFNHRKSTILENQI